MQSIEHGMFVRRTGVLPTGPQLVYLHGLGESGLCFEELVAQESLVAMRHAVVDLPGYGRSSWPSEVMSLCAVADHLASWWRDTASGPAVFVGHSMGGVVSQLLAERHPNVVRAIVNVEGNLSLGDCTFSGKAAAVSAERFVREGMKGLQHAVYLAGVEDPAHRGYYAGLRLCDPRAFHAHAIELVAMSRAEELGNKLAALPHPKLYIAGVPGGACVRSQELLDEAGVPWTGLEPAGHWPFIDQQAQFAQVLEAVVTALA